MNHGVTVRQEETSVSTPIVAPVGIPFVPGAAPVQSAAFPVPVGEPVLCTSWQEAVEKLGFSEDWKKYNICEVMYSHFKLYGLQPVIFCNLLDPSSMSAVVAPADVPVVDNRALLPLETISDTLVVKAAGGDALVKGTDYDTYYAGEFLVVELLSDGSAFGAETINAGYKVVTPEAVTPTVVATGIENIEKCTTTVGVLPDLILAPKYSTDATVAAVMATKAAGINSLFTVKSLIDISTEAVGGATTYGDAIKLKGEKNLVDERQILCWPKVRLNDRVFHLSTHLAGIMATVDAGNDGIPYESPSNNGIKANGMLLDSGASVGLTVAQANVLNANGIVTALNFIGNWTAWGNYTACYPANRDVKDFFIPISRMFDWVGNTVIRTMWSRIDKPLNPRIVGNIVDTLNIWLNGIVGAGYLLGARVEAQEGDNPIAAIREGKVRFRIYMTPPGATQEIEFVLVYDSRYVELAFAA